MRKQKQSLFREINEDIQTIRERDPAARSKWEVLFLYPGLHAIIWYRFAHWFYCHKHFFIARWLSQRARHKTGIEIHPGATIGKGLFIDHGSGVVIGETTEIGDYCTIYQGATLGGTGKDTGKRHPTLKDNVLVGAGAKVLGPIVIGNNVRVAAGAVVLEEIPDNCTAVGVPAKIVRKNGRRVFADMDQVHICDPVDEELQSLRHDLTELRLVLNDRNVQESYNNSQL
jgi:serine O-acetyltransferase